MCSHTHLLDSLNCLSVFLGCKNLSCRSRLQWQGETMGTLCNSFLGGWDIQIWEALGKGVSLGWGAWFHAFQRPPFRKRQILGINTWSVTIERYRLVTFFFSVTSSIPLKYSADPNFYNILSHYQVISKATACPRWELKLHCFLMTLLLANVSNFLHFLAPHFPLWWNGQEY